MLANRPRGGQVDEIACRGCVTCAAPCGDRHHAIDRTNNALDLCGQCFERGALFVDEFEPVVNVPNAARSLWPRHNSPMSGRTPQRLNNVRLVRLKSCKRQSLTPQSLSKRVLAFAKSLMPRAPVTLNTKSPPGSTGCDAMICCAFAESGITTSRFCL